MKNFHLFQFLSQVGLFFGGCFIIFVLLILFILYYPVYFSRWVASKLAQISYLKMGKIVCLGSAGLATDFIVYCNKYSSRNAVVVNMILEGTLPTEEVLQKLKERWISAKDIHANLIYPELQQYPVNFLGFMFWKPDENFEIEKHVHWSKLAENVDDNETEQFVVELVEKLLNKRFPLKQSPWEIHVLHNYRNTKLSSGPMTMLLMRLHHCLADGPSFITAAGEGLFNASLSKMGLVRLTTSTEKENVLNIIFRFTSFVASLPSNMIYLLATLRLKHKWKIPKENQTGIQYYARTDLIPVDRIKTIKNKHNTGFTSVVIAAIAAGISKANPGNVTIPTGIPIPLRNSSKSFTVNSTAILLDLPISLTLSPVERLQECDRLLKSVKDSTLPILIRVIQSLVLRHTSRVTRFLYRNRTFPMFITSFPGPSAEVHWNHANKLLGGDYTVGGLIGCAGVGIAVLSCMNYLRVTVTAEKAALSKAQLEYVTKAIENEISILYDNKVR